MPVKEAVKRKTKIPAVRKEVIAPEAKKSSLDTAIIKNKLRQPKVLIGAIVVVLIVGAFFLKGLFIAAIVNGEPITRMQIVSELEKQGGKQALSSLVNQALILQEAKKKKIQVSQKEIDEATKQIEDSLKSQGQSLDTALAAQGMTRQDLSFQMKLRSLVEKLLADKTKVTDKEIADYIEKNKDMLPTNSTPDETKKSVGEQLKQQKMASASQSWLEELAKNAKINYFVSY